MRDIAWRSAPVEHHEDDEEQQRAALQPDAVAHEPVGALGIAALGHGDDPEKQRAERRQHADGHQDGQEEFHGATIYPPGNRRTTQPGWWAQSQFDGCPSGADNQKKENQCRRSARPRGGEMATANTIDVARVIDQRRLDGFSWSLLVLSFAIIIFDGYDISAIAFAGPPLMKAFGIANPGPYMGLLFSASLFGMLFGAPGLGYIGDRLGRKTATMLSSVIFGIFTLACVWATSIEELRALRFLAGIGIGGMMPNLIALNAEYAPRRVRATMIIVMFCGVTLGGAVPGWVSIYLVPQYGWQILFWIGGVLQ